MTPEELQRKLSNLSKDMLPAIEKAMTTAAMNVEGKAKENCQPGTSPYYRAPHITGTMLRSISSKVEMKSNEVHGVVGAGVEYAIDVHEGTSRMEARPFILDAILEKESETVEILSGAVEEAIRRHTR